MYGAFMLSLLLGVRAQSQWPESYNLGCLDTNTIPSTAWDRGTYGSIQECSQACDRYIYDYATTLPGGGYHCHCSQIPPPEVAFVDAVASPDYLNPQLMTCAVGVTRLGGQQPRTVWELYACADKMYVYLTASGNREGRFFPPPGTPPQDIGHYETRAAHDRSLCLDQCESYVSPTNKMRVAIFKDGGLATPMDEPDVQGIWCICADYDATKRDQYGVCANNNYADYTRYDDPVYVENLPELAQEGVVPSGYRKRALREARFAAEQAALANPYCPAGLLDCRVGDGYECIDPRTELESCGGCLRGDMRNVSALGSDCTALPGVNVRAVTCSDGKCLASACKRGWRLSESTCVPV